MIDPKILYIDDEEDLVMLAQSFFEEENLHIDICTDYDEAVTKLRTQDYDIVITDANMPKGTGQQLVKLIKSEGKFKGKFILVTGNIDCKEVIAKTGFDLIIYKPIHFQDLVEQVKQMLVTIK